LKKTLLVEILETEFLDQEYYGMAKATVPIL